MVRRNVRNSNYSQNNMDVGCESNVEVFYNHLSREKGQLFDNKGNTDCLLDAKVVARILRVSLKTVYRWAKIKLIPSVTIGPRAVRFRPEDINAIVAGKWEL